MIDVEYSKPTRISIFDHEYLKELSEVKMEEELYGIENAKNQKDLNIHKQPPNVVNKLSGIIEKQD